MKAGWTTKRLEELVEIRLGRTPPRAEKKFWDPTKATDNTWVSIADLSENEGGVITESKEHLSQPGADSTPLVKAGTLLVSFKLSLGKVAIAGKDLRTNEAIAAMPIKDRSLDVNWLKYFFQFFDWNKAAVGEEKVKGKALNKEKLKEIEIPLPPLAEQKRIVALLDEAFAGIDEAKAKSEANLDSSSGLFDMVREDLMREPDANTPSCSFDEICKIDSALVDPRDNEYAEKLHVGGANIESKTGRLVALQTARQEGLKSGKFPFQKGMVLYSKIRPNLMKVARPDFEGLCSADMYPLAPVDGRVCRDYLYHLLLTERFTRFALLGSERAGMPKVNRDYLSRFTTKLPSISEQQAFASKLDALEQSLRALRELLTKKMAALQELKSSLLTQAFAGELTA